MKKVLFILSFLVFVIGLYFVFTNPSEDQIRKEVELFVITEIEKKLPESARDDGYASDIIHLNVNESISISDYYFFKKVNYKKNGRTDAIGYGYLNAFHGISK